MIANIVLRLRLEPHVSSGCANLRVETSSIIDPSFFDFIVCEKLARGSGANPRRFHHHPLHIHPLGAIHSHPLGAIHSLVRSFVCTT